MTTTNKTRQRLATLEAQHGRPFAEAITRVVICTADGRYEYSDLATAKAAHPELSADNSILLWVKDGQDK